MRSFQLVIQRVQVLAWLLTGFLLLSVGYLEAGEFGKADENQLRVLLAQATAPLPPPPSQLLPEKPPLPLTMSLRARQFFDTWKNNLIARCLDSQGKGVECNERWLQERDNRESGSQFTTRVDGLMKLGNFEVTGSSAYVRTYYSRDHAETVGPTGVVTRDSNQEGEATIFGYTDTEVNIAYNNFDRKTSGVEAGLRLNLPTGMTSLTTKQLRAIPSSDVVTTSATGEGFNIGPTAKLWKQSGNTSWFLGARGLYLGEYDLTKDVQGDTVSQGFEAAAEAGFQHPVWRGGYNFVLLKRGELAAYANLLYIGMSLEKEIGWFFRTDGTLGYTIVTDVEKQSAVTRESRYNDGLTGALDVEAGYKWKSASLSLQTGIKGTSARDPKNEYVSATAKKVYVGLAGSYDLLKTNSMTLSLVAQARYFDLDASPAVTKTGGLEHGGRKDIDYDGFQGFIGIQYFFARLF